MKQRIRTALGLGIVGLTIVGFIWYIKTHPAVMHQLAETSVLTVVSLLLLYVIFILALMLVLHGNLMMFNNSIPRKENFYVVGYSSLINFFGPGQSGPAARGAYLKLRHGISLKQYAFGTLIYYGFYALFSGVLIAFGLLPLWLGATLSVGGVVACLLVIAFLRHKRRSLFKNKHDGVSAYSVVAGAALLQVLVLVVIYFIELKAVGINVSLSQALIYTGAANFALFVALTPGAIGFREAFLVFTQQLHHIPNNAIVAANVLDRAVYISFLGGLFLVLLTMQARRKYGKLEA